MRNCGALSRLNDERSMCARFNLKSNLSQIFGYYSVTHPAMFQWTPRYDIRPTHQVPIIKQTVDGSRVAELARWGLIPKWAKSATEANINARSETVATKPSFREAIKSRRCIIPADGFYEFESTSAHTKQKWHIFRADHNLLSFAGLWETWLDDDEQAIATCAIVTTEANSFMAQIHDRMPVVLSPDAFAEWLDPALTDVSKLGHLFTPCPDGWLARDPVANIQHEDSPRCILPVKQQRSLFD